MKKCTTHVHEYAAYLEDLRDRLDDEHTIIEYLQDLWGNMTDAGFDSPPAQILVDALRSYGPYTAEYALRAAAKSVMSGAYDPTRSRLGAYFLGICRRHEDGR
jgi:hypothetical protein